MEKKEKKRKQENMVRAEEFMGKVKSIFPRAKAGKDGKTITLDFQEE